MRSRVTVRLPVTVLALALLPASAAWAGFCVGVNCGAGDPSFHCHSINSQGNQCWDQFDDTCEPIAGFGRAEAMSCTGSEVGGVGGTVATQGATAFGGYNTFATQIRKSAAPRISELREAIEREGGDGGGFHFSEIVAAAEHEQWTIGGLDGDTNGLRLGWSREAEGGLLFGLDGSYQQAEPDVGPSTDLVHLGVNVGHTLGPVWSWQVSGQFSDLSGFADTQLYGGGAQLAFASYSENGHVFSGGVIGQYTTSDDFDDDIVTVSGGLAYGFPIGERLTWDFDGYAVHVLDPEVPDDTFYLVGTQVGFYFTPRFALHLGYRILEGLDAVDSDTFTLGFATRWE